MVKQQIKDIPAPKNPAKIAESISIGLAIIAEGKSKVEAVKKMYPLIKDEPREVIWQAFEDGASLTPKGAITYLYNVERDFRKTKRPASAM